MQEPSEADQEGPVAEAEAVAARISTDEQPLGQPGKPLNRRSPFFMGLYGAAGVAVTYLTFQLVVTARDVLVLIGLALFIAIGLEPAVSWLVRGRFPRWAAVITVMLVLVAAVGGFLAAAIPVVVAQATTLAHNVPQYLHTLQDHSSLLGQLNDRFHVEQRLQQLLNGQNSGVVNGVLGAGAAVLSALSNTFIVAVLTVYFLADLPRIRRLIYRLIPHSRRPRAILIGDEIFAKVGGYVLGNLATSLISGILTLVWLLIFQVPYPLLLSILVAVLDLVPVVGSSIGGAIVALVSLTVSLPVAIATVGYFIAYRFAEDYFLVPKIIGTVLKVPSLVTVVAVLLGGVLLGIIGALVAIPVAAALLLVLREVVFPRLDRT
ncbi:MAG TPA: AI-2E family transporter [Pseudonocardiaceae bacterium]|nr:AI-2E family transporter [Pseudonocardiaceae bacterium]